MIFYGGEIIWRLRLFGQIFKVEGCSLIKWDGGGWRGMEGGIFPAECKSMKFLFSPPLSPLQLNTVHFWIYPAGIYLLKVNNRNTKTKVWSMLVNSGFHPSAVDKFSRSRETPGEWIDKSSQMFSKGFVLKSRIFKIPADIYLSKVNNRNTTKRCKNCLKLTIKTTELGQEIIQKTILRSRRTHTH